MRTVGRVASEIRHAWRLTAGTRSFVRWSADIIAYRVLRIRQVRGYNRPRTIKLKCGARITYRLNRADIFTLREVWVDEVYRLVQPRPLRSVIDLGANIGLASVWLAKQYGCGYVVGVEPLPGNVGLLRRNLEQNGIAATVLEAAVSTTDGTAFLAPGDEPNVARLASRGLRVRTVSMPTVVEALSGKAPPDLVKIDVEGAEQDLFGGDLDWLEGVELILAEIHSSLVDHERIVATIERSGLRAAAPVRSHEGAVASFSRAAA